MDALTAADIKAIRIRLRLTQAEAGAVLGGGPNAFAKYESGAVAPSKPMDVLLRLLGKRPDVLSEITESPHDVSAHAGVLYDVTQALHRKIRVLIAAEVHTHRELWLTVEGPKTCAPTSNAEMRVN